MSFNFGRQDSQPNTRPLPPTGLAPPYDGPGGPAYPPVQPQTFDDDSITREKMRAATKPRIGLSALTSFCLFVTVVFLIMVEIGNTYNKAVLRDIWFIRFDFADISPAYNSTPGLGYGIAEAVGFYDFYQVGLWNYCQGNNGTGIASCTNPSSTYWFNPVDIFTNQLEDGSTSLPQNFYDSLDVLKTCSHWMFGLFMAGACLSFVLIPVVLVGIKSRWFSLGLGVISFLNALCVFAATVIATVMYVLTRDLLRDYEEIVNLVPTLGTKMFVMMWIATGFALGAFIIQAMLSCFCASRRDVHNGNQQGRMRSFF